MFILGERRFINIAFDSEEELENVVVTNSESLFGPSSIFLPKALIHTKDGFGTIPDGFVIDLANRRWFIVEVELSKHSVWNHIAPQVAKQYIASTQIASKQLLVDLAVEKIQADPDLKEKFADEEIEEINIRGVLGKILESPPVIALPIDSVSTDLRDWANSFKVPVKLWVLRKNLEIGRFENVMYEIPDEFPSFDSEQGQTSKDSKVTYDVTLADLIDANLLHVGDKVYMPYKPRKGEKKVFEGAIEAGGEISVLGKSFSSPSYAAIYCLQQANSARTTANGWISWKTADGVFLADLRQQQLNAAPKKKDNE